MCIYVIQFRRDYSEINKIASINQWMIYFLRVYSCKLGCNPQKYTFLEIGDRTAHSVCTHTCVIYIKVIIYTKKRTRLAQIFNYTNRTANVHGFRYRSRIRFTWLYTFSQYSTIKNKTMMKEMVHLSELLGNHSNCTKQHIKQLWLILLMNCYTNVNVLIFSPVQLDRFALS